MCIQKLSASMQLSAVWKQLSASLQCLPVGTQGLILVCRVFASMQVAACADARVILLVYSYDLLVCRGDLLGCRGFYCG